MNQTTPDPGNAAPGPRFRTPLRRILFPLLAVGLVLLAFVLIEIGLRTAGVAAPREDEDPQIGFSAVYPLFELIESEGVYRTTVPRQIYFGTQEFSTEKPDSSFRAFVLGGSTVRGRPYQTHTSFARWLEIELEGREPGRRFQAVNCGGLSYASYRLRPILREVLEYEPDLIVLAIGHNEFLEDRTFGALKDRSETRSWMEDNLFGLRTVKVARSLFGSVVHVEPGERRDDSGLMPEEVDARLDEASGYASYHRDPEWQQQVIEQFRTSMRAMIDDCQAAQVPVVLVQLGTNLRDCPPFKSEHRANLDPADEQRWIELFESGSRRQKIEPAAALKQYLLAHEIDDQFALLAFRIARTLDRLGRSDESLAWYLKARDLDVCPLRKISSMNEVLREIAEETGTRLVDSESRLAGRAADGIPGYDAYVDHVHPTIGGHQQIAQQLAQTLEQMDLVEARSDWESLRRAAYRKHLESLGASYLANGRRRVGWLENWARRYRLAEEIIPDDVRGLVAHGHRLADFGAISDAWGLYAEAIGMDPQFSAECLLQHAHELVLQGRPRVAGELLSRVEALPVRSETLAEVALGLLVVAQDLNDRVAAQQIFLDSMERVFQAIDANSTWNELLRPDWAP